jgi:hypothetical protein
MKILLLRAAALAISTSTLLGCSGLSIGIGLPIGGLGSVGAAVNTDGRVSGGAVVGAGNATVGVSGSGELPRNGQSAEPAASAPPR